MRRSEFRSTLDIDFRRLDSGYIIRSDDVLDAVRAAVSQCGDVVGSRFRRSASGNGFHVELLCSRDCASCRFAFDSTRRLDLDLSRPAEQRDVLWGRKSYVKGGCELVLSVGPWEELVNHG